MMPEVPSIAHIFSVGATGSETVECYNSLGTTPTSGTDDAGVHAKPSASSLDGTNTGEFAGVQDILESGCSDKEKAAALIALARERAPNDPQKWLENARRVSQEWSDSKPLIFGHYFLKGEGLRKEIGRVLGHSLGVGYEAMKQTGLDVKWQDFNRWYEEPFRTKYGGQWNPSPYDKETFRYFRSGVNGTGVPR